MIADIVILCAGTSRRLGVAKQHVTLVGQPLIARTCEMAVEFAHSQKAQRPPLVVVGPFAQQDRDALTDHHHCEITENPHWQQGLPASLACAIKERHDSDAVLVLLVDQYRVRIQDLLRLHQTWQQQPYDPATAAYASTVGPPVIWPSRYFDELETLRSAAKTLLRSVPYRPVAMPEAAIDLDVPEDLDLLRQFECECSN